MDDVDRAIFRMVEGSMTSDLIPIQDEFEYFGGFILKARQVVCHPIGGFVFTKFHPKKLQLHLQYGDSLREKYPYNFCHVFCTRLLNFTSPDPSVVIGYRPDLSDFSWGHGFQKKYWSYDGKTPAPSKPGDNGAFDGANGGPGQDGNSGGFGATMPFLPRIYIMVENVEVQGDIDDPEFAKMKFVFPGIPGGKGGNGGEGGAGGRGADGSDGKSEWGFCTELPGAGGDGGPGGDGGEPGQGGSGGDGPEIVLVGTKRSLEILSYARFSYDGGGKGSLGRPGAPGRGGFGGDQGAMPFPCVNNKPPSHNGPSGKQQPNPLFPPPTEGKRGSLSTIQLENFDELFRPPSP